MAILQGKEMVVNTCIISPGSGRLILAIVPMKGGATFYPVRSATVLSLPCACMREARLSNRFCPSVSQSVCLSCQKIEISPHRLS